MTNKISTFLKKNYLIILILLVGLFFRVYNYAETMSFAHDQDLYSWIAKDIVVNQHPRLVGQITSVPGVFIGPLFYYVVAFFYFIFKMDPLSVMIPVTILGVFTIWSFYYIVGKEFSRRAGLLAAFIYAISYGIAMYDRWAVPTQPAILWSIWFLYLIFEMLKGNLKTLPLYGLLVGLFWHVHIALIPILPIPLISYFLSKGSIKEKLHKLSFKNIAISLFIFLVISSPVWLFELRHNFSQIRSMVTAIQFKSPDSSSLNRFYKVMEASATEMQVKFFNNPNNEYTVEVWGIFIISLVILRKKKLLKNNQILMMLLWMFLIMLAQWTSKMGVSEYYFTNIFPIYLLIVALMLDRLLEIKILNIFVALAFIPYFILNYNMLIQTKWDNSYLHRKDIINYIKTDAAKKGYPCVSINYIAKFGDGVGFRYISWYQGLKVIKYREGVPSYDIVIPWETSASEIDNKFGRFGLIIPDESKIFTDKSVCDDKNNELDTMLGYVE